MTQDEAQALEEIRGYALANRIEYGTHARQQMRKRNVGREDVYNALTTARSCKAEPPDRWKVLGKDTTGAGLTVVVVLEDGVVVVTAY